MKKYYDRLIHTRFFPLILILLIGGYVLFFFNLFYLGYLPIVSSIQRSRYALLDPAANFIQQKNYVVNVDHLKSFLVSVDHKLGPDKISIYIESLNSGANTSVNKDLNIWPASLAKLPLAIAIMNKIESGQLRAYDSLIIMPEDEDPRSGTLYQSLPGTSFTINQLITALMVDSDNTAQHMLLKKISPSDLQDLINNVGLEQSLTDPNGKISAKGYTRFFRTLYTSSYLNKENSQKLLNLLSRATFKDFLSQGIPDSTVFAHKYGEDLEDNIYSDSGIVYLKGRPYMITVMIQNTDRNTAKATMKSISDYTYKYFNEFDGAPPLILLN